jgi:hypothetical protein
VQGVRTGNWLTKAQAEKLIKHRLTGLTCAERG